VLESCPDLSQFEKRGDPLLQRGYRKRISVGGGGGKEDSCRELFSRKGNNFPLMHFRGGEELFLSIWRRKELAAFSMGEKEVGGPC